MANYALDGDVVGTYALVSLNHWNLRQDRVVVLCARSLIRVKVVVDSIGRRSSHGVIRSVADRAASLASGVIRSGAGRVSSRRRWAQSRSSR
jgi:hypothetical protein